MGLSASLANALSGLTATARTADVVSANVANATTDGYGRRDIALSAHSLGGNGAGVVVDGIIRDVDMRVIGERRLADAGVASQGAVADFLSEMSGLLGHPEEESSLTGRLARLESNLLEAASRPDSEPRILAVLDSLHGVSDLLNRATSRIQSLRMEADQGIAAGVAALNSGLAKVADLNHEIRVQLSSGYDATALMDERQRVIDQIGTLVPLREVPREAGQVALYAPGGAILLEGRPATIGFDAAGVIVADMLPGSPALSGLSINGMAITSGAGPLRGGSIGAMLEIRDQHAVDAQARLDAVARDLVERFSATTADPTLNPGDVGLFTDSGAAFNPLTEVGLAGRLEINALVDPARGGQAWRLRTGLNAATAGEVGFAGQFQNLVQTLALPRVPASGGFIGAARSAPGLAADVLSLFAAEAARTDAELGFSSAKQDALRTAELQSGVDTDAEMQRLLVIEQQYAANARVIATIDDMLNVLMGI